MVAIDGDSIAAGAIDRDDQGTNSGAAYVFVRDGAVWRCQQKLLADDGKPDDWFAQGLALRGDCVVVGANASNENGRKAGAVYVFTRQGDRWRQRRLLAADGREGDVFGQSVAFAGDHLVAGRPGRGGPGQVGQVYVLRGEIPAK